MRTTEFRLLGSLEVRAADRSLELGGHKQRAVLALLLLHANEVVSVDRLIDGIWGPTAPRTASAYLQNCISKLRRELGPGAIETRSPGYVLRADEGEIDTKRLASLVEDARGRPAPERLQLLTEALSLWRGPALADFAFEDFAQAALHQLDELRLEAIEGRIEAQLELGRHAGVIVELEALVGAQRSRERLRYLQMLALYRAGRQVDALEVFQETRLALAEDLGLEPSEELKALERMILEHDPLLDVAEDGSVPPGRPSAREARRIVTLLFAEPMLADDLDAETRRSAAARCLAVAASIVERHGGRLEHLEGTELAGTFGFPAAHEDDALRAVRAASEIRAETVRLGLQMRFGVETGALDVAGGRLDGAALADARSIKDAASPGEILIGAAALHILSGAIEAVPTAEENRYRLLGLIPGAPAVRRRFDTELVGREAELDRLEAAVDAVWQAGAARSVVVLGEPGIGKTRLAAALVSRLRDRALPLSGRCAPYGEGTTYLPLADVVRGAVGSGDPRRAIASRIAGMSDGALVAERLASIVTGEAAAVQSAEIFWAVRRLLEELAKECPLLVVLDDVHWAEPELLDLVEYLAGWCEAPVVLLCLARPELLEVRPGWAGGAILLDSLSDAASRALLDALPERANVGDDLVAMMLDTAEGNPLFLEQIAALAADRPLAPGEVPPTLDALLASRLDLLSGEERDMLERAAVVGREFSRAAVDALSPPDELGAVSSSLMALVRRRLVRPDHAAPPGEDGFRFEHVLIRDAAYASVPGGRRADMHERLARWLDSRPGASPELVGFHLERAFLSAAERGDPDDRLGREAAARLGEAANMAIMRLDTAAAVRLLRRAVSLLAGDDEQRRMLEIELGYALKNEGALGESVAVLSSVERRARELGDRRSELRARIELAWPRLMSGDTSVAAVRALADEALPFFEAAQDYLGAGRAARMRANASDMLMQYAAAEEDNMRAAGYFRQAGFRSIEVARLSAVWTVGPTPVDVARDRVILALADSDRAPAERGYLWTHLGELEAMRGCFGVAREHLRQAEMAHRGFAQTFALSTVWPRSAAAVEMHAGDPAAADAILKTALEYLDAGSNAAWFATLAAFRAVVLVELGRIDEAIVLATAAGAAAPADDLISQITWRQAIARAYARIGQPDEAEHIAVEAVDLARTTEAPCYLAEALLALAEVRAAARGPATAVTLVAEALELLAAKGNLARARQVKGLG